MMNRSGIAQLASQGRGGDSMLVHMRPDEVAGMQRMARQAGTSMTINPKTGLPEAFQLKDLFNINTYTKPIRSAAESIGLGGLSDALSSGFKTIGQNAQYILPFIPGSAFAGLGSLGNFASSPVGRGLLAGGIGSLAGGRFNLKRGLMSGLSAYGLSSAYQGLQAAGGVSPESAVGPVDPNAGFGEAATKAVERAGGVPLPEMMSEAEIAQRTGEWAGTVAPSATPAAVTQAAKSPGFMGELEAAGRGIKNIAMGEKPALKAFQEKFGRGAMGAAYMGTTGLMALNEQEKLLEEARAQQKISEAEYAQYRSRIENAKRRAAEAVKANPYQFAVGGEINEEYQLQTPQLGGSAPDQKNVFGLREGGELPEMGEGRPMMPPERKPRLGIDPRSISVQGEDLAARFEAEYPIGKTGALTAGLGAASVRTPEGRKIMPTAMDVGARGRVGPGILSGRVTKPMMGPTQYQAGYTIPFAKGGQTKGIKKTSDLNEMSLDDLIEQGENAQYMRDFSNFRQLNEQLSDAIDAFRQGKATASDLKVYFPSYNEFEIAQMFGRTDSNSAGMRNPNMARGVLTPKVAESIADFGKQLQRDEKRRLESGNYFPNVAEKARSQETYAKGGMPPRYIDGPGDGMSDSVKARIGGIQEARLADGEFVIPADVVSHLGNGSSKAGAKQLYAMMDRVRKARVGTTKQGKEIKPTKLMPA